MSYVGPKGEVYSSAIVESLEDWRQKVGKIIDEGRKKAAAEKKERKESRNITFKRTKAIGAKSNFNKPSVRTAKNRARRTR